VSAPDLCRAAAQRARLLAATGGYPTWRRIAATLAVMLDEFATIADEGYQLGESVLDVARAVPGRPDDHRDCRVHPAICRDPRHHTTCNPAVCQIAKEAGVS